MLGPRIISTPLPSPGGLMIMRSSITGGGAAGSSGKSPNSRGSVIRPRRALTAAAAGPVR